jgi:hypothetical protein
MPPSLPAAPAIGSSAEKGSAAGPPVWATTAGRAIPIFLGRLLF